MVSDLSKEVNHLLCVGGFEFFKFMGLESTSAQTIQKFNYLILLG